MAKRRFAIRKKIDFFAVFAGIAFSAAALAARAQTADQAWLGHALWRGTQPTLFFIHPLGESPMVRTAAQEFRREFYHLYGISSAEIDEFGNQIVIGTATEARKAYPQAGVPANLAPDSYWIHSSHAKQGTLIIVAGGDERGALYGTFALLREFAEANQVPNETIGSHPAMPIRWVDEWDNANSFVERGYGGPSIFFENGHVRGDLSQVSEYARLLASVGINGCNVNNVNGAAPFLTPDMIKGLARIADAMRPWGVRLAMSVDIASPQKIGGLNTFDPLDPEVKAWWAAKVNEIYQQIPDLAGFTVKADSEGQPGPASYGRSPADAANVLAAALAPHGGVVLYRAFVYNNHLDYNDLKADRARAAYDIFHPLDGHFLPNVIVQIKEGPIDFQAQEPISPLFAGLHKTSEAMELQIAQEYLGQQRHLVYIAPMWKWVLDFDLRADNRATPVKDIIEGKSFNRPLGGMIGVSCVGRDWLGSPFAMANLYAFGRLAWDPNLTPEQIAAEWTRQTISNDPQVIATVDKMLMQSWPAYVDYTGFLGTQTLTDITGSHYGPNIEASERNGWGQWHRDDAQGIGMDRTVATGTGFIGQYPPAIAKMYESAATTPDNLLLFFHHVPWTYKLHSGKTVIQYVYDSHYKGAAEAAQLGEEWATLKDKIDPQLYNDENARLQYQAGHAIVWRDAIVQYFLKESGIPDARGRAAHFPGRLEAEDARLTGYTVFDVHPWEDASRGKAVTCAQKTCSAEWTYSGVAGQFNIAVQYFDLQLGAAHFTLDLNGRQLVSWAASDTLPSRRPNGDNSTRFTYSGPDSHGVNLKPGDTLRVEGVPDDSDSAALDYIEVDPVAR
ncbi:Alpha glucuronidase [Candidatus Sulfotelmatomonas gaucii]|uniref:Xylan alpha-1,2-glucuronidase n=1 Tax=Candidatus Sulfuritelmatomonas gaucii TaxID=2043161 RepID=A0A2N9M0K6_9BACT|nr:Alpha glucuronidase [Candidatus Sulfotelmatomonas gaucii]